MADNNNLATTKYLDGAGVQTLYSTIKDKVTQPAGWTSYSARSAGCVKTQVSTTNVQYYLLGDTSPNNDTYTTPTKRSDVYIGTDGKLYSKGLSISGGSTSSVLLSDGGPFPLSSLSVGSSTNATNATNATNIKISKYRAISDTNYHPLLLCTNQINSTSGDTNETPLSCDQFYYKYDSDKGIPQLHGTYFVGDFEGSLDGNATSATNAASATNATNASKVNVANNDNTNIYLLGSTSTGNTSVYRNSKIYANANQLFLPAKPTEDNAAATKKYVDDKIENFDTLNQVLKFKGTINSENAQSLLLGAGIIGEVYIASEAGTYAGEEFEVGDMAIITKSYTIDPRADSEFVVIQRNIPGVLTNTEIAELLRNL